jgi:hypothetical protein
MERSSPVFTNYVTARGLARNIQIESETNTDLTF